MSLDDKLDNEMPAIMLKCIKAYLEYAQKYSDKDIWNVVPPYFKVVQEQVAMITNSLQNFLASGKIVYGEDKCCPQKLFQHLFNNHCTENNLGKCKFNPDFYMGPFSSRGLEVRLATRTYANVNYTNLPFVFGLDINEDIVQFSNDL